MATVRIVAFNKQGYKNTIAVLDEQQVRMLVSGINTETMDIVTASEGGQIGVGVAIDPQEFPEMVRFVVTVTK